MNVQDAFSRYKSAVLSVKAALKKVEDCSQEFTWTNWAVTGKSVYDLEQSVARLGIVLSPLQLAVNEQNRKEKNR